MNVEQSVETVKKILLKHFPQLQALYLFGSAVDGSFNDQSDIDLAILLPFGETLTGKNLDVMKELLGKLNCPVDLVNLRDASTVMQFEVITKGRLLHQADEAIVIEFEMLTASYYQKLNEERSELLKDFYSTGEAVVV